MLKNAVGSFVFLVDFIPQIMRCMQKVQKINPLSLTAADLGAGWWWWWGGEKEVCPINCIGSWAHACNAVQSPSPTQYTAKTETTITEAYPGLHCTHERKGRLERRCFTFDLVEGWFVEGRVEDCARRSMKVLSFNMSHMWEGPTGLWKVLKAAVKVAAVSVNNPTLHFTTHCHTFVKKSDQLLSHQLSPNGSSCML